MKKILMFALVSLFLVGFSVAVKPVDAGNPGSIWTTLNDCGDETQDANHYAVGDTVFINGNNFAVNTTYSWSITGKPGGASSDPNIIVASGNHATSADGTFCFEAYIIPSDDDGEYHAEFNGKGDNYRVDSVIPEFGVIAAAAALVGALGIFLYRRK